jgi:hypothetical protein
MIKSENVKLIEETDWNKLVQDTYNRPYNFQQQDGCKPRGVFKLKVPCKHTNDCEMHDSIPYEINGDLMGVKFNVWLARKHKNDDTLFWTRNFYPDIYTVANDLYSKGLLKAGTYLINIDW